MSVIHPVTLSHEDDSVVGHILISLLPPAEHCRGCGEQSREQDRRGLCSQVASILDQRTGGRPDNVHLRQLQNFRRNTRVVMMETG